MSYHYVFVYGTLKKGYPNHRYLENSDFMGNATINGTLLDIGSFPALLPKKEGDNSQVIGEVYGIDNETLANLDSLEGEGIMYHRKSTGVIFTGPCYHLSKVCHTYFWGLSQDYEVIASGEW